MNFRTLLLTAIPVLMVAACSREEPVPVRSAYVTGKITVDENLDSSSDYSGIRILTTLSTGSQQADTLFFAETDTTGFFEGRAQFSDDGIYPVMITRNQNTFGIFNMVYADGDTIRIEASLPNVNQTLSIQSGENDILTILSRIERNFTRVANFINAGGMAPDSIRMEIEKWSDIYWELFEEYPTTFVGAASGENSVSILSGWNDSLMVNRGNRIIEQYNRLSAGARATLTEYYAETHGLNRVLQFLEELEQKTPRKSDKMEIQMERIEILYDSSRTVEANRFLNQFEETYAENELAMQWAENISYDLEFLAPGYPFPELEFVTIDGDSLNTARLSGKPFLLEITRFDNMLYQQQYDRTVAIYQIYRNFDLEIITVPLASTEVMVQAFFEERSKLWNIIQPNSFDMDELAERLNLNRVPTRFLVNSDGTIIRRYIGNEYDDVVRGLQQITTLTE